MRYPPEGGALATTLYNVCKQLARLRAFDTTIGCGDRSALSRDCSPQPGPCTWLGCSGDSRSSFRIAPHSRIMDSHGWRVRCRYRDIHCTRWWRRCLGTNHRGGPDRHSGNDWSGCVVHRRTALRKKAPRKLKRVIFFPAFSTQKSDNRASAGTKNIQSILGCECISESA